MADPGTDLIGKERPQPVQVENVSANVKTIIATVVLVSGLIVWLLQLKADVGKLQSDVSEIKLSVQAISKVNDLQNRMDNLDIYGSKAAQKTRDELESLRQDFKLHVALTVNPKKEP